ncbi:extracellular solute-binding protein, family 5 [Corynebacterium mustelae]|uniref:Extracellular solute-binding protein, family 5 n=1 Tax=Corynebacterium mustelae TaxID=571915 RepID=A0A0G3H523_9CORY|nr:ABC transporter substrate-binding protein [Corynebacterium mustelae]AKK06187.1 extracellular solute-binding protein, family 5 [Corynebacterium mustelae]
MKKHAALIISAALATLTACTPEPTAPTPTATTITIATEPLAAINPLEQQPHPLTTLLYQPLFSYLPHSTNQYHLDTVRSLGNVTDISPDATTYTITLHNRSWSDQTPITTNDIELWWQLSNATQTLPETITKLTILSPDTFTITADQTYNPNWFIANQLNHITPLPQHAWNPAKTLTPTELLDQITADASNPNQPRWKITNGPYVIAANSPQETSTTLAINPNYDGLDKPTIPKIILTNTGEQHRTADYQTLPFNTDPETLNELQKAGFTIMPRYRHAIEYAVLNMTNPLIGETYIRNAMQQLVDQQTIIKTVWNGHALPGCGPTPTNPNQPCAPTYNPMAAQKLLEKNGWAKRGGKFHCIDAEKCGREMETGQELTLNIIAPNGAFSDKVFPILERNFASAGIKLYLTKADNPFEMVSQCEQVADCSWQLGVFTNDFAWNFPIWATGEEILSTLGKANLGSFSSPEVDAGIEASVFSDGNDAMSAYIEAVASENPLIWLPTPADSFIVVRDSLVGVDPNSGFLPQDWRLR